MSLFHAPINACSCWIHVSNLIHWWLQVIWYVLYIPIHCCIHHIWIFTYYSFTYEYATEKNMKGDVTECHCTHVWHVSLNQYGYHITNMSYTAIMLNGHMDPTIVHRCAKTQQTLISNAHVIAIYVSERNMAWKLICCICQIFEGLIWKIYNICMPHMMCQSSFMQQGALYTYLTYITAQLLLAH